MPDLNPTALDSLRQHLAPELAAENERLRARCEELRSFGERQTDLLNNHVRQLQTAQDRITLLEMLLRDFEAAELLHDHCVWCEGMSAPEECERCVLLWADLRMRRSNALLGGKG
jgi:hypothetical protein